MEETKNSTTKPLRNNTKKSGTGKERECTVQFEGNASFKGEGKNVLLKPFQPSVGISAKNKTKWVQVKWDTPNKASHGIFTIKAYAGIKSTCTFLSSLLQVYLPHP